MIPASVDTAIEDRPRGPVAIAAAMREELARLRARASGVRPLHVGCGDVVEATLCGRRVLLAATGEGAANASRVAEALLEQFDAGGLIVAGTSGGLSPALRPGSVIVARRVLHGRVRAPAPDPRWVEEASRFAGVEVGTIVSAPAMLCTRDAKAAAYAGLDEREPAAADLETAAVAQVAAARAVPYIAVRAISDAAGESLPLDFNRFRDASGRIDRFKVVRAAASRPGLIAPLWRLRRRVAVCSENLADLICRMLERDMP